VLDAFLQFLKNRRQRTKKEDYWPQRTQKRNPWWQSTAAAAIAGAIEINAKVTCPTQNSPLIADSSTTSSPGVPDLPMLTPTSSNLFCVLCG
jgi:hypothetical protein